jgi:hypothetical protein
MQWKEQVIDRMTIRSSSGVLGELEVIKLEFDIRIAVQLGYLNQTPPLLIPDSFQFVKMPQSGSAGLSAIVLFAYDPKTTGTEKSSWALENLKARFGEPVREQTMSSPVGTAVAHVFRDKKSDRTACLRYPQPPTLKSTPIMWIQVSTSDQLINGSISKLCGL